MRINEKTLLAYANSNKNDKEGYLGKRGEGKWICAIKKCQKSHKKNSLSHLREES